MTDKYNKIARIEKAISKKYGKKAIMNPKSNWNKDKEERFQKSAKKFYKKISEIKDKRRKMNRGLTHGRPCPICSKYFLSTRDEAKLYKYGCCHDCFIDFVDGREDRWATGWRPDKESVFKKR